MVDEPNRVYLGDLMRKLSVVLPMILSMPLFITAGVTCGCEPDAYNLADQMRIFEYPGEAIAGVEENLSRGRNAFLGRDIRALTLHQTALDKECAFVGDNELHCEFWNQVGLLYSSGRFVEIRAGSKGKVKGVSVTSVWKLFGIKLNRPNDAFQQAPVPRRN